MADEWAELDKLIKEGQGDDSWYTNPEAIYSETPTPAPEPLPPQTDRERFREYVQRNSGKTGAEGGQYLTNAIKMLQGFEPTLRNQIDIQRYQNTLGIPNDGSMLDKQIQLAREKGTLTPQMLKLQNRPKYAQTEPSEFQKLMELIDGDYAKTKDEEIQSIQADPKTVTGVHG